MFKPLSLFIGLRYTRAKRRNHFISFISMSSMLGIALGVMVLITVLSVMNGFDAQIKDRVFSMAPQITLSTETGQLNDWHQTDKQVNHFPGVTATSPYIAGQGMLVSFGQVHPALVFGVIPEKEDNISDIQHIMSQGSMSRLTQGSFGIVLGQALAANLSATIGDKVTLITPIGATTPMGFIPRYKRFTVVGIFDPGTGFGFDTTMAYINMKDAQTLYQMGSAVSGLRLKLNDLYQAPQISEKLSKILPSDTVILNWTQQYGAFFQAIALEKTMMFLILLLIIAVAAFNLVSSLVMLINDKQADIAILRTLGATPSRVMHIFIIQGTIIGSVGTVLGLISGIFLSLHVTELVNFLQEYFNIQLLSSSVYYVNYLPSQLELKDVIEVCVMAFAMSLLATLYPAWRASRIQPVEALRYE
ncbi:MAG: lipoprotein-releasing ABC transporter permease subunit [Gammaproteobacteria bacterium]|nr:lipoprotein-releasing ABC transporter permease subunit [Gammaproteobacteria bacterium]